ncbi:MAG: conjugal transfer protein TraN [Sterolibacteriaceae bacterium]|uniref:Conjugal transfer protein TraN n=1 Tax=Candidatus Methylophosphatis roskildensis TaxID=2899263 RepID=A0A9D7E8S8_9PROT|nr:conjugal transfer protein TraN [Candidatus Methylophosphatis roskildensis]
MQKLIARIVLFCVLANQTIVYAQSPRDEAAAAAASANITIQGFVSTPSAGAVVPGLTSAPPETGYYGNPSLSTLSNARVSACASSTDPACQAVSSGISSAVAPKPPLGPYDPAIAGVRDIANDPGSILGDLTPYYAGCTTSTVPTAGGFETRKCDRYAALGMLRCSKKLTGEVTRGTSCTPGTWINAGRVERNPFDEMLVQAYCDPTRSDGMQTYRFYAHGGRDSCIGWQTRDLPVSGVSAFQVLAPLSPHWEGRCVNPFYVAVAPSPGCSGSNCDFTFKFGEPTLGTDGTTIVDVGPFVLNSSIPRPNGAVTVADTWDNGCASLEANGGFGACTRLSGPSCVEGPSTKKIQGQDVFAACWEYQSTYDCSGGSPPNECAPLAAKGCTLQSSACREAVPDNPTLCGIFQDTYQCPTSAGSTTVVSNCSPTCAEVTKPISPALYNTQSCYSYLERNLGQTCQKSLDVAVTWTCPAGSTAGPTRDDAPPGSGTWTCVQPQQKPYCDPPLTGPTTALLPPSTLQDVCTDPASGAVTVAPIRAVDVVVPAIAVEAENWANGCAGLEARVPPGKLPPDGVDTPIRGPVAGGVLNKCERKTSACTVPAETRVINDHPVTRSCWGFGNSFDCLDLSKLSDCANPRVGECTQSGEPACIDSDASFTPPICTAWRTDFNCKVRDAVFSTVKDCGPEQPPADEDFARTVAFMEAGREAGRYLDPATMRVFKGADNRCDKRLWGLVNCCNQAGSGSGSLLNNASVASTATTLYKAAFSTYTHDALFVADAPEWVMSAFESLAGGFSGFNSALAGVAAGDISVMSFLSSLSVFAWIAIIMAIIQWSGILDCPESSQVTAMKREARLCVDLGEYCSSNSIFGSCTKRTRTFCCFNSRLSRIINEQGRAQLGTPWGSAQSPRCDGFTIDELQRLNFAAMDLTEFYADIVPTMPNLPAAIANQTSRAPSCYFGNGKC